MPRRKSADNVAPMFGTKEYALRLQRYRGELVNASKRLGIKVPYNTVSEMSRYAMNMGVDPDKTEYLIMIFEMGRNMQDL